MGSDGFTYYEDATAPLTSDVWARARSRKWLFIYEVDRDPTRVIVKGSQLWVFLEAVRTYGNLMEKEMGPKFSTHGWASVDACLAAAHLPRAHTIQGAKIVSIGLSMGTIQFREKLPGQWDPAPAVQEVRYVRGLVEESPALPAPDTEVVLDAEFARKD